jgi:hypothetical protein
MRRQSAPSHVRGGLTSLSEANPPHMAAAAIWAFPQCPPYASAGATETPAPAAAGGAGSANEGGAIFR